MTNQNKNPLPILPDPLEDQPAQLPAATPVLQLETASKSTSTKPRRNFWRAGLISTGVVVVLLAILFGPRLTTLLNLRGSKAGESVTLSNTSTPKFMDSDWSATPSNDAFVVEDGKLKLNYSHFSQ
jgi:hypothetical protein